MAATSTRKPPGESGPSLLTARIEQNEARTLTFTLWAWSELNGWQTLSLTGKTIEFRAKISGTWVIWDNSTNGNLTLANQTTNKGKCDVAITSAKGSGTAGDWPFELWDSTSGSEHKHGEGTLSVTPSGGPA